jgi:2-polyprenyl-3-methyl-5-hydroxy-6-metoxy-1,4-benzoquinol methylase/Zn-finger protein
MSEKLLTIGMATYDDYDGVYFTIQALRMFHLEHLWDKVEIIIIDNNPESKHGKAVKEFCNFFKKNCQYIPFQNKKSTSVRNEIFKHAKGKYTICTDCHVLFQPNAINTLLKYYEQNPETSDLIQGPLWNDDLKSVSTHFDTIWRDQMYGIWAKNTQGFESGQAFEIPMMGLGVFSCRTAAWPEFNLNFKSFGGEEWYIHEKFRKRGDKCLCLPAFGWVHRFTRPNGVPYPNSLDDRIYNYLIGALENYGDENHKFFEETISHFSEFISKDKILEILEKAKEDFINSPYYYWQKIHQNFELNYHKQNNFRWPGRELEWNEQWNNVFEFFGEFKKDSFSCENVLLDIGCGSRPALQWFEEGIKYNIDPLLQDFLKIKELNQHWENYSENQLINAPAEELQEKLVNKCDFIICWNVLDHSYNWKKILENCVAYLKTDGIFLLGTDHGYKPYLGHPGIENSNEFFEKVNELFIVNKYTKRGFKTCRQSAFLLKKK